MKFTPEAHLKAASLVLRAAEAATGPKKLRLESLAHAFQIRAKQLEAKTKNRTADVLDLTTSSKLPLMTSLNDEPSRLGTKDVWEQHLTDLLSQPDSASRSEIIERAKAMIAEIWAEET
jgi:hypothetical protein